MSDKIRAEYVNLLILEVKRILEENYKLEIRITYNGDRTGLVHNGHIIFDNDPSFKYFRFKNSFDLLLILDADDPKADEKFINKIVRKIVDESFQFR